MARAAGTSRPCPSVAAELRPAMHAAMCTSLPRCCTGPPRWSERPGHQAPPLRPRLWLPWPPSTTLPTTLGMHCMTSCSQCALTCFLEWPGLPAQPCSLCSADQPEDPKSACARAAASALHTVPAHWSWADVGSRRCSTCCSCSTCTTQTSSCCWASTRHIPLSVFHVCHVHAGLLCTIQCGHGLRPLPCLSKLSWLPCSAACVKAQASKRT